ncbi:MAG TPA: NAD(P)H-hydrate dehydratase [Acidobacteriaceae bacterium]|nr:NAD(P)H-hydrate dehydratase [Acidobacteriaceae bacterium]
MEILTAAEMAATDRRTAEGFGISFSTLMENAGTAVARFCLLQYPAVARIAILCGKGNNGGDGLVAARVLAAAGREVKVLLLGSIENLKPDAAAALRALEDDAPGVIIEEITDEMRLDGVAAALLWAQLMIDAIVGTGFKPPLRGIAAAVRDLLAPSTTPVLAVDLPSGWDADSMEEHAPDAFRANAVVTFTRPKHAHIFGNLTGSSAGPVVVAEIGSPDAAVVSGSGLHWAGTAKSVAEKPRAANSNKGMYGHVLVVGGSYGTAGAPSMSSLAALRAGAGLVTASVPHSIVDIVAGCAPELMLAPLKEGADGAASLENLAPGKGPLQSLIEEKRISTLAIGPGLSQRGDAGEFARRLIAETTLPAVVDADALNAFAGRVQELNGEGRALVLTPHPGEMARLTGLTVKEVEADRIDLARCFATEHKLTLVLKGWRTLIAHPDGRIAVNTSGNPALAKGGSGDILTGIVAAMLAQYARQAEAADVARAVEAAVYLHGLAANFAARERDEHTVLATDAVAHLSDAFRYRTKNADGLTWLCGLQPPMRNA